jgi:hypothetical protein
MFYEILYYQFPVVEKLFDESKLDADRKENLVENSIIQSLLWNKCCKE